MAMVKEDLLTLIDMSTLECLNQKEGFPVANAFTVDDSFLESDTDHQLLVKVEFRQPVKLSGVRVWGVDADSAPTTVKVFQNKPHIGFAEAENEEPTELLNFGPEEVEKGEEKTVRFVRFQCVSTLQIFIEENQGDEVTKIKRISLVGQPAQAMDMKDWKPTKG